MHRYWAIIAILGCLPNLAVAQGLILQAGGPVNRSMGGASTAAPIDSIGAMYWNPASISGMERSETAVALDFLFPNHTVESSLGAFAGSTDADTGSFPVPNIAVVHHTGNEALTFGASVSAVAGFGTNLPADPTNPVLAPPPTGLGQIASNALFIQIAPVLSYAVTDRLSIAAGPTITTGRVTLEPFVLGSANANGTYSTGNATRYHWGSGFQIGSYFILNEQWRFGASLKSPVWMENFEFNGVDENDLPRKLWAELDLPMIFSIGASFRANEDTLFALDVRFIDYANADGLGDDPVFDATGALGDLGHGSIMSTAVGMQRKVNEKLTVRGGYTFNQNPVSNSESFYNLAAPVIYQHMISTGGSVNFTELFSANLAYSVYLENSRVGPIVLPGIGAVPGSSVTNTLGGHLLSFGFTMRN